MLVSSGKQKSHQIDKGVKLAVFRLGTSIHRQHLSIAASFKQPSNVLAFLMIIEAGGFLDGSF